MALQEPLRLAPRPHIKVWGGDSLKTILGQELGDEGPIGEVWALVDRQEESTVVDQGAYEGRTLRGLMLSERAAILGASDPSSDDTFPVLIKWLDAQQDLSVQVHPDLQAAEILGGGAESKDEFWYILSADPGARIYLGLKQGTECKAFASEADNTNVVNLLESYPVKAGDVVFVPSGTVHSIGAGIRLVEIQDNSNTTYRLYDWGRKGIDGEPRSCQVKEALASINYEHEPTPPRQAEIEYDGANGRAVLCESDSFRVEHLIVNQALPHDTASRAWAYVVLAGKGELTADEVEGTWTLRAGETWLCPASLGPYRIGASDGELSVLRVEARA